LIHIVLVEPRNPLNIGAAARAMTNLGFPSLRLVAPYRAAIDEARSGPGADAVLAASREFATVEQAIADCAWVAGTCSMEDREQQHPVERLELAARRILAAEGDTAILFGSEKSGLSNEDMAYCQQLIRIPTEAAHTSMNLGQAVAVTLWELARNPDPGLAPAAQLDLITARLLEILAESGYQRSPAVDLKIRRLIRRMRLNQDDGQYWLGMLRQIAWKIGKQ
jgi:tRNA/rRNA methyltransferase